MMDNKIIQSLWVGNSLSSMEVMCINSYVANGHDFHLYTYEEVMNVPPAANVLDANEIIPKDQIFVDSFGGYVNLSNQFRYSLLLLKGGWWVDMDTVCLKPFDFRDEFIFSSETSDPYKRFIVNTTYIKSSPKAKFLKDCLNFIQTRGHNHLHWGELGVNLISRMVFRNNLGAFVRSPETFCPVSVYQLDTLITDSSYEIPKESYALHWWNEIWKRHNIDKEKCFPPNSTYEELKRRYLY